MKTSALRIVAAAAVAAAMATTDGMAQETVVNTVVDPGTQVIYEDANWGGWLQSSRPLGMYFKNEAVWFQRVADDNFVVAEKVAVVEGPGGIPVAGPVISTYTTDDLLETFKPGWRTTFGVALNDSLVAEARYFGLFDWSSLRAIPVYQGQAIRSPFIPSVGGVVPAGDEESVPEFIQYSAELNSFEANLRQLAPFASMPRLNTFVGFRYINVNENARVIFDNLVPNDANQQRVSASTNCETTNNLVGMHFGADAAEWYGPLMIGLDVGGGLYANLADRKVQLSDVNTAGQQVFYPVIPVTEYYTTTSQFSASFQAGLRFAYQIFPCCDLNFGYECLLLTGIAYAPEGGFSPAISADQVTFYHGPSVGLNLHWGGLR